MKYLFVTLIIVLTQNSLAQNVKENFFLQVEGTRSHLNYIKASAELMMGRNTKYCRGMKMPKSIGNWTCKNSAPRVSACQLKYKCHFVSKRFNRLTESKRLRSNLKAIPHLKSKYTVSVIYNGKTQTLKSVDESAAIKSSAVVAKRSKARPKRKIVKAKRKRIKAKPSKIRPKKIKKQVTLETKVNEEELEEIAFLKGDESLEEVVQESSPVKKEKKSSNLKLETKMKSFALSYISISDDLENSLGTINLSWTPHIWFSKNIGIRGNIGAHSYKTPESDLVESESFLIYDLGIFGVYKFQNIYLELGLGMEMWNSEAAESASSLSYGIGYEFDHRKLYIIDRVSFGMASLSNEIGTKEMRLTLGASF